MSLFSESYRKTWQETHPHIPLPSFSGMTSSRPLEVLFDPQCWTIKRGDPAAHRLWDMTQELDCGYFIPPFQRGIVWDNKRSASFIESAYLGISLGSIVYNDASEFETSTEAFPRTDRWLIDGRQRCSALWSYTRDMLTVFADSPFEHRWSDLTPLEQGHFCRIQIGFTKLAVEHEADLRLIYDRLNFGGVNHAEHERASM